VQTLSDWRKRDPAIDERLDEAYERARLKTLSEIKLAGERDWRAHRAWLELTRPGDYRASAKIDVSLRNLCHRGRAERTTGANASSTGEANEAVTRRAKRRGLRFVNGT
jgi:hypothetical protein